MSQYFYLNDDKKWVGPYSVTRMIFAVIQSEIHLHTPVWSKKTSDGSSDHPSKCVRKRTIAHQLSFLPLWLFPVNTKAILQNWKRSIVKQFKRNDGTEAILANPIEAGNLLNGVALKHILPSLSAILDFNAGGKFEVTLSYFTREQEVKSSTFPAYIKHSEGKGFSFSIVMYTLPEVGGVMFKESYGLHRKLFLKNQSVIIEVAENSTSNFTTRYPYQPQVLKGNFSNLKTLTTSQYNNGFQRLIVSVNDTDFISPASIVQSSGQLVCDKEAFNSHESTMGPRFRVGISYIDMQIEGYRYHIYELKDYCLVIDSQQIQDHELFRIHSNAIRKGLAVLSGKYYADETYYLTSGDQNFENIDGLWYVFENATAISLRRIVNMVIYDQHGKDIEAELPQGSTFRDTMPIEIFENLCLKLIQEDEILRTAELVISAMDNPDPVQQGAMYSVALETITGLLSKINEDKLNPIPDKKLFKKLNDELKTVLNGYRGDISPEGMTIIGIKLGNLNSPTNRDKLVKTFYLYGIALTNDEIKTINERNTYLHGNSPLDAKFVFELSEISLKLHSLILKLLLKYIGYNGHIINLAVYAFAKDEVRLHDYIKNTQQIAIDGQAEMERLIDEDNKKAFEAAKDKWLKAIAEHTLSPIIEII
ncbi:hypothetical protein SAMN05421827_102169 [Pedobacter terrae]|uniref:ApeA N-terminal domain-containing protein n=1 Tax=Pedobacter terrae TaxID=405671 RepID=A0A1G7Q4I0_9SPHI|nr:hypothetical protein [Pedobacter terrae]SDF93452.1 hypothetical protein SAMN05421827_102169 [Pedobacter terrae]